MAAETAAVARRCEAFREAVEAAAGDDSTPPPLLDLSGCGLTSVPAALFMLMRSTPVARLSLAHNQLRAVPPRLQEWSNTLQCTPRRCRQSPGAHRGSGTYGPPLLALPPALPFRADLDLSDNQLTSLPEVLCLPVLTTLNLADNRLAAVPSAVFQCERLAQLDLSRNQIAARPDPADLARLPHLADLRLDGNPVAAELAGPGR